MTTDVPSRGSNAPSGSIPAPRDGEDAVLPGGLRCAQCGYDLTGTPSASGARCPECGHTMDDTHSRNTREQAFFRRFGWWVALGTVLTLIAIVGLMTILGERAALFAIPLVLILICWVPYVLVARLTRDIE